MRNEPFDALDPTDGFVASRMTFYAALYPKLRQVARKHGYALTLHGSLTKDLDVVAVPWVEGATDPLVLVRALTEIAHGLVQNGAGITCPHGRHAWTIFLGSTGGYIDLSVMPRIFDVKES